MMFPSTFRRIPSMDETCFFLSNRYSLRVKLQKADFFLCWILFLSNMLCTVTLMGERISSTILFYTLFYIQISIFSRVVAYAFDVSNAVVKTNCIPDWLKLHHSGVLLQHVTLASFILGRRYNHCFDCFSKDIFTDVETMEIDQGLLRLRLMVFVLGCQASHNTWTKRFSIVFYWGNAFGLGVTCSIASLFLSPCWMGDSITGDGDHMDTIATFVYALSLVITVRGMLKLYGSKKTRQCKSTPTLPKSYPNLPGLIVA